MGKSGEEWYYVAEFRVCGCIDNNGTYTKELWKGRMCIAGEDDKDVALKYIHKTPVNFGAQEIQHLKEIDHANIITLLASEEDATRYLSCLELQ